MLIRKEFDIDIKGIDDAGKFSGYASTFGNEDLVGDIVQKGAFTKTLLKGPESVQMFYQHDSTKIIGEYTKLYEDEKGLFFEGQLYIKDIQLARETHFLMQKRKIKAVSIGYRIESKSFDGEGRRLLKEVALEEISPVTYPANTLASIDSVKSVEDMTEREFEKSLRDVMRLSQKQAKALISGGYAAMNRDDSEQTKSSDAGDLLAYLKTK